MSSGMAHPKLEAKSTRKIPQSAPQGVSYNKPHWKCFCSNTHSMRSKQEELEALAQSQGCDIIGMSKTGGLSPMAGMPQWMVGWGHKQVQKIPKTPGWCRVWFWGMVLCKARSQTQCPGGSLPAQSVMWMIKKFQICSFSCFVAMRIEGKSLICFVLIKWNICVF